MNIPDHFSKSLEKFFGLKILKFFDADPLKFFDADPDFGSGILDEKIRARDP
jgi:hypothetical protein